MDYKTKPTSLRDIRKYSVIVRRLFNVPRGGPFPVLQALEHLGDVFGNCNYLVVEDTRLSPQTMARCVPNVLGGFTIEIKQSVYDGAYEKGIGAFLAICRKLVLELITYALRYSYLY